MSPRPRRSSGWSAAQLASIPSSRSRSRHAVAVACSSKVLTVAQPSRRGSPTDTGGSFVRRALRKRGRGILQSYELGGELTVGIRSDPGMRRRNLPIRREGNRPQPTDPGECWCEQALTRGASVRLAPRLPIAGAQDRASRIDASSCGRPRSGELAEHSGTWPQAAQRRLRAKYRHRPQRARTFVCALVRPTLLATARLPVSETAWPPGSAQSCYIA